MSASKNYRRVMANFKRDEEVVINFLDTQDNITHALRYLIMKEVKDNGYRNLSQIVPSILTEEYFNYDSTSTNNDKQKEDNKISSGEEKSENEIKQKKPLNTFLDPN